MRVLLVQPPQADPAQPYSSIAVLLSAWRRAGLCVEVEDLNVAFFNYLCSPAIVSRHVEEIEAKLARGAYSGERHRAVLHNAATFGGCAISGISTALGVLRDKDSFYDPRRYAWAVRFISRTLDVVSAPYYPGRITLQSFRTAHSHSSSKEVLSAADDAATNLFYPYCAEIACPAVMAHRPDVVAISVTFQTQLIPAWTLARRIKQTSPDTKVVFGGATITRIREALRKLPSMFDDVDAAILFEGETALPALLEEWQHDRDGLRAPNVMVRTDGEVDTSSIVHTEDLNQLAAPDHNGLPLDAYWWPEPAILVNSSRGCYYGRCAFCMISPATWGPERMGKSYRIRSTDRVVSDLLHVHKQTGASAFNLANDILPPRALEELGEALAKVDLAITWDSEIRLERGLSRRVLTQMATGGCRHLRFGLETASPRVAALMDKGTDNDATERILSDCRDLGITVSLLCQVAFPGETRDEAHETLRFLQAHNDRVSCVSLTQFALERGSKVCQQPARFGVTVHSVPDGKDLTWVYGFTHIDGGDTDSGIQLYEEIESLLDKSYPDRDLFYKGGLGHAHTTLYTRHYSAEQFLSWNRESRRGATNINLEDRLRIPQGLAIRHEDSPQELRSHFTVTSVEIPELLASIDGDCLILLAAACQGITPLRLLEWAYRVFHPQWSPARAAELVDQLFSAGLLVNATGDSRQVPMLS